MKIQTHISESISERMVLSHVGFLSPYKDTFEQAFEDVSYALPEASLRTPYDADVVREVQEKTQKFVGKTKLVLLVGIGGSDMGTSAVYEALRGHIEHLTPQTKPTLRAFSTIEPRVLREVETLFAQYSSAEEIVLVVISKSGTTTETLTNANILFSLFCEQFDTESATGQTIVISGSESSLTQQAQKLGMLTFSIPKNVGGRFSVFSTVGLVPLTLLGLDCSSFLEGARNALSASITTLKPPVAAVYASCLFEAYLQGARLHELFLWNPELEMLGKWYRQLLAESIGKTCEDGTKVGFSPTTAIGSTDLHSVGQLIFGGRNDRFTTFVSAPSTWTKEQLCSSTQPFTLPALSNKSSGEVTRAIYDGVQTAYKKNSLPFLSLELEAINERELGAFMALHMTTILNLAQLFGVNAFDQPAVETYKHEVRILLTK